MQHLGRWLQRITDYVDHPDPLVAAANRIALLVGGNQPFYPFYLLYAAGWRAWPSLLAMASTPFFLIVPRIARRLPWLGRVLLCLTSVTNTAFYITVMGPESGLELFLIPCVLLGAILFRRRELLSSLALSLLPIGVFLLFHGRESSPFVAFSLEQNASMLLLNAVTVGTLTAALGIILAAVFVEAET